MRNSRGPKPSKSPRQRRRHSSQRPTDSSPPPKYLHIVRPQERGVRLDRVLSQSVGMSRNEAKRQIAAGTVWINGKACRIQSRAVFPGERITWLSTSAEEQETRENPEPSSNTIHWPLYGGAPTFLYQDRHVAILDKPSGIPVEPTPKEDLKTCLRQLEAWQRQEKLPPKRQYATAAHRLDAGASGAVAFAMSKLAAKELGKQFAERTAKRVYHALVVGQVPKERETLRHHMDRVGPGLRRGVVPKTRGKLAITHYEVIQRFEEATLVEVRLETGRTHQIRVHFSHLAHPLVGDWLYCSKEQARRCPPCSRLFLHARSLTVQHPQEKSEIAVESPLPTELEKYLLRLTPKTEST